MNSIVNALIGDLTWGLTIEVVFIGIYQTIRTSFY